MSSSDAVLAGCCCCFAALAARLAAVWVRMVAWARRATLIAGYQL